MAESQLPSEERGTDPRPGEGWVQMFMSEEKPSEYIIKKVSKWYSQHKNNMLFTILLIGKTGSGKSTLINNFAGEDVATVGHGPESETSEINKHSKTINGVNLDIYDSPGLQDSRQEGADQRHMRELKESLEISKVDLVIFCYDISNRKLDGPAIQTFRTYHKLDLPWEKTIFAITFADDTNADTASVKVKKHKEHISTFLKADLKLSDETVAEIAFCPTGCNPKLHLVNYSPGEQYDWFTHLWFTALERLDPESMIELQELRYGKMKRLFHSLCGNGRNAQQQDQKATGDNVREALSDRYEDKWVHKFVKLWKKIIEHIIRSSPDSPEATHSAPPEREQEHDEATIESTSDSEREEYE